MVYKILSPILTGGARSKGGDRKAPMIQHPRLLFAKEFRWLCTVGEAKASFLARQWGKFPTSRHKQAGEWLTESSGENSKNTAETASRKCRFLSTIERSLRMFSLVFQGSYEFFRSGNLKKGLFCYRTLEVQPCQVWDKLSFQNSCACFIFARQVPFIQIARKLDWIR